MARIPIDHHHRANGQVVPITPTTFRLDATFRAPRRKRRDQLLAWALFGGAAAGALVALVGFIFLLYLAVVLAGGAIRHFGGLL